MGSEKVYTRVHSEEMGVIMVGSGRDTQSATRLSKTQGRRSSSRPHPSRAFDREGGRGERDNKQIVGGWSRRCFCTPSTVTYIPFLTLARSRHDPILREKIPALTARRALLPLFSALDGRAQNSAGQDEWQPSIRFKWTPIELASIPSLTTATMTVSG